MIRPGALLGLVLLAAVSAGAQAPPVPPAIVTESLPKATLRQNYFAEIRARGGTPPLRWAVAGGALPPGLTLDRGSGRIAGAATAAGEFRFTVQVSDAASPPQTVVRELVLKVTVPLTVEWKMYPRAEGNNAVRGAVLVINGTDDTFDLTFIAVAVNEIGKAFALGYQRFPLAPESTGPELDFGSSLPAGRYIVHVDAVAEVPARGDIFRARLQTSAPLVLTGLP